MTSFRTTVRGESSKHYPIILFPVALRVPIGWLRVKARGYDPCLVYARGRGRRAALPSWNFPNVKMGDEIDIEFETPQRAAQSTSSKKHLFDWNEFVAGDDTIFATDEPNGMLRLWSKYSAPFDLLRYPPIARVYRILGFYQAEGSKAESGGDFSFANTNAELIFNIVETMKLIGINTAQLYMELLQGADEGPETVWEKYAKLQLQITAVRPRSGRGGSACVVHAHNSKPFRGVVCRALAAVTAGAFPTKEAARAYAFGWLDGDGSITLTNTDTKLRLAGLAEEHEVVKRALVHIFDWNLDSVHYKGNKRGSEIGLRAERIIDLLDTDAFPFSMNRVRLLLGCNRRIRNFALGGRLGPLARWSLLDADGYPTETGKRVIAAYTRYKGEIEKAQQLKATAPSLFGVKGAGLPPQFLLRIQK